MVGRLRPNISLKQAQADLSVIASQSGSERLADRSTVGVHVHAARMVPPAVSQQVIPLFAFFAALVGLSLLIPCLNIGTLLLARSAERSTEMGIRMALGAGRLQLMRQLLTESLLISITAGIAGVAVFVATLTLLVYSFEFSATYASRLVFDWRVAAFGVVISLATTVMCGVAAALHSAATDILSALKDGESTARPRRSRLRGGFIVGQVAVSALLLTLGGLFVRSLTSPALTDLGFVSNGVLLGTVSLGSAGYNTERGLESL
jgi:hypothetical protein